jgi:hypothetical protein
VVLLSGYFGAGEPPVAPGVAQVPKTVSATELVNELLLVMEPPLPLTVAR